MTQSTPFKSVGQCLYIAYLMEVLPVTVKSSAQRIMEASMMQSSIWGPSHGSTTHPWFDRLTPLDVRAQCALIRLKVAQHLSSTEYGAICAHYGHLLTKANGVEIIAQAARVFTTTKNADAILALTWGALGTQQEKAGLSLRGIAKHYGLSKSCAQREQSIIRRYMGQWLMDAIHHIGRVLEDRGLVEK